MSRDDSDDFDDLDDISEEAEDNDTSDDQVITLASKSTNQAFSGLDLDAFFSETAKEDTQAPKKTSDVSFLEPEDPPTLSEIPKPQKEVSNLQSTQKVEADDSSSLGDLFGKYSFDDEPADSFKGLSSLSTGSNKTLGSAPKAQTEPSKPKETSTKNKEEVDLDDNRKPRIPLLEWSRKFRFMDGVEYIKLSRRSPITASGINIGGFMMNLYDPIDEEELTKKFGGGTYLLEAVQLNARGTSSVVDHVFIAISGPPRLYVGKDGKSYTIPSDDSPTNRHTSWREDNMILGRTNKPGMKLANKFEEELPAYSYGSSSRTSSGMTNGPASVFNSAAELLRMTNQNTQKTDDTKTLEILRAAQNDVQSQMAETAKQQQEIYKHMLQAKEAEVDRIRREQEILIEKTQRPLSDALTTLSARADNEVQTLRDQLFRIDSEYRERISELKDAQNSMVMLHQKEKETLLSMFQKEKEEIRNTYTRQVELLKQENNTFFLTYQKEKEDLKSSYVSQIDSIRQEHRSREHEIRQQATSSNSENISALKIQMDSLRDSHQNQLNTIQKESQNTINTLYQEISKLREDARERESKARDEAFKRESELKVQHIKELSDLKAETNERISNVRAEVDKREKDLKDQNLKNEKELKELHAKNEKELRDLASKNEKELRDLAAKNERDLKTTYELREKDLRERFEERERVTKESLEAKYQNTIDNLREKLDVLKSNSDEKVQQYIRDTERREKHMQTAMETNYKAQMSIIEAERDRLRSEVETMRRELDSSRKERKEMTDPIAKLKEIQSFKENLQRLGFMPEEDDKDEDDERIRQIQTELMLLKKKEEEDEDEDDKAKKPEPPKDFLGKIFHYGPSIAENLVVPVLQRFDSATKVANDALETQKLELTNQARMLELKSQELQNDKFRLGKEAELFKNRQAQIMQQNLATQTMQNLQFGRNAQGPDGAALDRRRKSLQERRMAREATEPQMQQPLAGIPQNMPPQTVYAQPPEMMYAQNPQVPPQNVGRVLAPQQTPIIKESPNPKILGGGLSVPPNTAQQLPITPLMTARSALQNLPGSIKTDMPKTGIRRATRGTSKDFSDLGETIRELPPDENVADEENKNLTMGDVLDTSMSPSVDTEATATEHEKREDISMSQPVSEGYVKLAEFVQQRMADQDTPEGAASKLKLGVFAGLVPKEVFNEAVNSPFEELYSQVKLAAEQKGYSKVASPKGEAFCQSLYSKLK